MPQVRANDVSLNTQKARVTDPNISDILGAALWAMRVRSGYLFLELQTISYDFFGTTIRIPFLVLGGSGGVGRSAVRIRRH